jgi:excisionase family DNA binding protein
MIGEAVRGSLVDARREGRGRNDGAEPILLDLHEPARALRVSERTAWGLARRGDLRAVRIGRRLLFDPADLRAFIERQKTAGAGAEK